MVVVGVPRVSWVIGIINKECVATTPFTITIRFVLVLLHYKECTVRLRTPRYFFCLSTAYCRCRLDSEKDSRRLGDGTRLAHMLLASQVLNQVL